MISRKTGNRASVLTAPQGVSRKNFHITRSGKLDPDADQWARRYRLKSVLEIGRLSRYVKGIKKIGLWDMGLISYPLGLLQNRRPGQSVDDVLHAISKTGSYQGIVSGGTRIRRTRIGLNIDDEFKHVILNHNFPFEDTFYFGVAIQASSASIGYAISSGAVVLSVNDGMSGHDARLATDEEDELESDIRLALDTGSSFSNPKFLQFYYGGPDNVYGGKSNSSSVVTNPSSSNWISDAGDIVISKNGGGFVGQVALFVTSTQIPSEDQMQSLYSLYRSSLGIQMGLP